MIEDVISQNGKNFVPQDTAYSELLQKTNGIIQTTKDLAILYAVYLLGFGTYLGFSNLYRP